MDEIIYKLKTDLPNTWGPKVLIFFKYKSTYDTVEPFLADTSEIPTPH